MSKPIHWEKDGAQTPLMPNEARLRNLTYSAPLYVDIRKTITKPAYPGEAAPEPQSQLYQKVFLGKIPIMLRSTYCLLHALEERDLSELNECPCDPGGYFIINGSEKVRCFVCLFCCLFSVLFVRLCVICPDCFYSWSFLLAGHHCAGKNGHKYGLRFQHERFEVCLQSRMSFCYGKFKSTSEYDLGEHACQKWTGMWNISCFDVSASRFNRKS